MSEKAARPSAGKVVVIDALETNLAAFARVVGQIPETEAMCFTSSRDALGWLAINAALLVIIDQSVSDPSAVDVIGELRGRGDKTTPIVMIGGSDRELQREALKRGASSFLAKPIDPVSFVSLARNLIELRGARLDQLAKAGSGGHQQAEALAAQEQTMLDGVIRLVELSDPATGAHARRVALFAEAIGKKLGLSLVELATLRTATRFHDVGKLLIPDRIFYKAGRLMGDEREIAKKHVLDGAALLEAFGTPSARAAVEIARSHHERYDGTGYPGKLRGTAIPPLARIVAVADAFSALTSRRPWRDAVAVSIAVEQIEADSGQGFEPKVVGAFRDAMDDLLRIRTDVPDPA